mgnify:CR=1 FL=1
MSVLFRSKNPTAKFLLNRGVGSRSAGFSHALRELESSTLSDAAPARRRALRPRGYWESVQTSGCSHVPLPSEHSRSPWHSELDSQLSPAGLVGVHWLASVSQ